MTVWGPSGRSREGARTVNFGNHVIHFKDSEAHMFGLGMPELLIIMVIVVVVFGASRLPQIGDGVGKMITNFRKSMKKAGKLTDKGEEEDEEKTDKAANDA